MFVFTNLHKVAQESTDPNMGLYLFIILCVEIIGLVWAFTRANN